MTPELEMPIIEAASEAFASGWDEPDAASEGPEQTASAKNGAARRGATEKGMAGSALAVAWTVIEIPVAQIGPNPFQPRLSFDPNEMSDLVASVKAHGVLQPVSVRTTAAPPSTALPPANGKHSPPPYHLVAGERRLRACRAAGRKTIPAIVRDDLSDLHTAELALVENVQRANLSVIEEARAYKRLMIEFRLKEERIAKKVGKSVQVVRDTLKLLALPEAVQQMLATRRLTASHGHLLLKLAPFEELCLSVASHAEGSGLTATALGQNLFPNIRQLRDKKLVAEIDYRTKFDWKSVCGQCPHKAFFTVGYNSYCAKPEEWHRKQTEAVELQKQEATRVLEAARTQAQEGGAVDISLLPSGTFRDLSFGRLPAGCCESCPCRSQGVYLNNPTTKRPLCMDPERHKQLAEAEREAVATERQTRMRALYGDAKSRLQDEPRRAFGTGAATEDAVGCDGTATRAEPTAENAAASVEAIAPASVSVAALAVWPLLSGETLNYADRAGWGQLMADVDGEIVRQIPWAFWQENEIDDAQFLQRLSEIDPARLLRFAALLLLAQEATRAIRTGAPTPLLDTVLGRVPAVQQEFGDEFEDDGEYGDAEGYDESYDYESDTGSADGAMPDTGLDGDEGEADESAAPDAVEDAWNKESYVSPRRDDEPYLMGLQRVEIGRQQRQARQRQGAVSRGGDEPKAKDSE